jgi:hypothetical protein
MLAHVQAAREMKGALMLNTYHVACMFDARCPAHYAYTAHADGNEEEVGNAFTAAFAGGLNREDVFITSKLWNSEHSPAHVKPACEQCVSAASRFHCASHDAWPEHILPVTLDAVTTAIFS